MKSANISLEAATKTSLTTEDFYSFSGLGVEEKEQYGGGYRTKNKEEHYLIRADNVFSYLHFVK